MDRTFKALLPLILALSFPSIVAAAQRSIEEGEAKAREVRNLAQDFRLLYGGKEWDKAIEVVRCLSC